MKIKVEVDLKSSDAFEFKQKLKSFGINYCVLKTYKQESFNDDEKYTYKYDWQVPEKITFQVLELYELDWILNNGYKITLEKVV